jgi:hypothetical protein
MAVPANTTQSVGMRVREDLSRIIEMTTPTETPFYNMCAKDSTTSRTPEWSTESIRAANADNAAVEGDDVSPDAQGQPAVVKNHIQTFDEVISVSDIAQVVATISGQKELARQIVNAGVALRTDIETRGCGNYASVAATTSVAGKFGSAQAWITTNGSRGVGGVDGGYSSGTGLITAATNGTQRAFTATIFKADIQQGWTNGRGTMDTVLVGPAQKVVVSGFAGVVQATNEVKVGSPMIIGAIDYYKTDFGVHSIIPSRFMDARSALCLTKRTWKITTLEGYKVKELGKTGHNERRVLCRSVTLKCLDEKQNVVIADLT